MIIDAFCPPSSVLAAWFRLKYPHIAIGALASSAPILQFDNIVPQASFYDAVSEDYKVSLSPHAILPRMLDKFPSVSFDYASLINKKSVRELELL